MIIWYIVKNNQNYFMAKKQVFPLLDEPLVCFVVDGVAVFTNDEQLVAMYNQNKFDDPEKYAHFEKKYQQPGRQKRTYPLSRRPIK